MDRPGHWTVRLSRSSPAAPPSAATWSSSAWAPARWASSTRPTIPSSIARSRSSCCARSGRPRQSEPARRRAWSARPRRSPRSRTPTSSRSTTSVSTTARSSWRWSTWPAARCTDWMRRRRSARGARSSQLFIEIGHGLAGAHAEGLIHRDFKPDNVLLDKNGVPKVVDFGLVRLSATAADDSAPARVDAGEDVTPATPIAAARRHLAEMPRGPDPHRRPDRHARLHGARAVRAQEQSTHAHGSVRVLRRALRGPLRRAPVRRRQRHRPRRLGDAAAGSARRPRSRRSRAGCDGPCSSGLAASRDDRLRASTPLLARSRPRSGRCASTSVAFPSAAPPGRGGLHRDSAPLRRQSTRVDARSTQQLAEAETRLYQRAVCPNGSSSTSERRRSLPSIGACATTAKRIWAESRVPSGLDEGELENGGAAAGSGPARSRQRVLGRKRAEIAMNARRSLSWSVPQTDREARCDLARRPPPGNAGTVFQRRRPSAWSGTTPALTSSKGTWKRSRDAVGGDRLAGKPFRCVSTGSSRAPIAPGCGRRAGETIYYPFLLGRGERSSAVALPLAGTVPVDSSSCPQGLPLR